MAFDPVLNLSDLDGSNGFVINGINSNDGSYESVSGVGDVNGDGIDDIIIGALFASPNGIGVAGESYVVFGSSNGFAPSLDLSSLDGSDGFIINGINFNDRSGGSVSGAGDINGDGIDDIIIGANFADPNNISDTGESYIVFGNSNGFAPSLDLSSLDGSDGFTINGIDSNDQSGISVNGAGDINGDGIDDIIIGAWLADPDGISAVGESYVVFGRSSGFAPNLDLSSLDGNNGFTINGIDGNDVSGGSVSDAGDVNGDDIDDIIIGAPEADANGETEVGQSYVVFGSSNGFAPNLDLSSLDGTNGFIINGINFNDRSGGSVSGAGDINGDGIDDIIIRAWFTANGNSTAGESYVVFGRSSEPSPTPEIDPVIDLVIDEVTLSATEVTLGDSLDITWTVRNQGTGATSESWSDRIYLSTDETLSDDDIALEILSISNPELAPDQVYSQTASVSLSDDDLTDGEYYVLVETGDFEAQEEIDESNNTNAALISILPAALDGNVTFQSSDDIPVTFSVWRDEKRDDTGEIDLSEETYLIVHGFAGGAPNAESNFTFPEGGSKWMGDMAAAIQKDDPDANVVLVDWSEGAAPGGLGGSLNLASNLPRYEEIVGYALNIGDEIARYLTNFDPSRVTLIGHSLGGHVVGDAGYEYTQLTENQKISTIIGLDPAGPTFEQPLSESPGLEPFLVGSNGNIPQSLDLSQDPSSRLTPNDAQNVIVIHTSNILGFKQPLGTLDLYINPDRNDNSDIQDYKHPHINRGFLDVEILDQDSHAYAYEVLTRLFDGQQPEAPKSNFDQFLSDQLTLDSLLDSSFYQIDDQVNGTPATVRDFFESLVGLNNTTIEENSDNGTRIGELTPFEEDLNPSRNYAFTLIDDAGGRFSIEGNQLIVADGTLLDFETERFHTIEIQTTYEENGSPGEAFELDESTFRIDVLDVPEDTNSQPIPNPPEETTRSKGEPHLTTFDGVGYSFQGAGEFTLVESLNDDFNVQVRYVEIDSIATVATAVATIVDAQQVEIDSEGIEFVEGRPIVTRSTSGGTATVSIDGEVVEIPDNGDRDIGNSKIYRRGEQYTIVYAGENGTIEDGDDQLVVNYLRPGTINIVDVFLGDEKKGQVQGLGGNLNDNPDDDVALPDGTPLERPLKFSDLYGDYRDAWRIKNPEESLFDYEEGQGPDTFYNPSFPVTSVSFSDLDPEDQARGSEAALAAGYEPDTFEFESAAFDFAITNDPGFLEGVETDPEVNEVLSIINDFDPDNTQNDIDSEPITPVDESESEPVTPVDEFESEPESETITRVETETEAEAETDPPQPEPQPTPPNLSDASILRGTEDDDIQIGSNDSDIIFSSSGNDTQFGLESDDNLYGEEGNDTIFGNQQNDFIEGGDGNDLLFGGEDNDTLRGQAGDDTLFGNLDEDWLYGEADNDLILGNQGNDQLRGGEGNDSLHGGRENDTLEGGQGNDLIYGDKNNDLLIGVDPNQTNSGTNEIDTLAGGSGSDIFVLGDELQVYYDDNDSTTLGVNDYVLITDFDEVEDSIQLTGSASEYRLETAPENLPEGIALYRNIDGNDELIAIIQATPSPNLASNSFVFV